MRRPVSVITIVRRAGPAAADPHVAAAVEGPVAVNPHEFGAGLVNDDFRLWRRGRRRLCHDDVGRRLILRRVECAAFVIEAVANRAAEYAAGDRANERTGGAIMAAAVVADDGSG